MINDVKKQTNKSTRPKLHYEAHEPQSAAGHQKIVLKKFGQKVLVFVDFHKKAKSKNPFFHSPPFNLIKPIIRIC